MYISGFAHMYLHPYFTMSRTEVQFLLKYSLSSSSQFMLFLCDNWSFFWKIGVFLKKQLVFSIQFTGSNQMVLKESSQNLQERILQSYLQTFPNSTMKLVGTLLEKQGDCQIPALAHAIPFLCNTISPDSPYPLRHGHTHTYAFDQLHLLTRNI